ncbi:MAG: protein-L-isoaspartate O-methyltransferase [Phaeodactylibacter sp.]|nr:protein-L-isoaspartate O-methyltransferase [Phaeodactylibacter sp.]
MGDRRARRPVVPASEAEFMTDFEAARRVMVDRQLRTRDVTDHAILAAFAAVPREKFVPSGRRNLAYLDDDLPIRGANESGPARSMIDPVVLARMVQALRPDKDDVALVVGCATGYSAGILSRLAGSVVALEADEDLAETANTVLPEIGADNVAVVTGDLAAGYPGEGPYDIILFDGAVEKIPETFFDQLKGDGRLACVVGHGGAAALRLFGASKGGEGRFVMNAAVAALPGFERQEAFQL